MAPDVRIRMVFGLLSRCLVRRARSERGVTTGSQSNRRTSLFSKRLSASSLMLDKDERSGSSVSRMASGNRCSQSDGLESSPANAVGLPYLYWSRMTFVD